MALDKYKRPIPVFQPPLRPPPPGMLPTQVSSEPQPDLADTVAVLQAEVENLKARLALLEAPAQ